VFTPVVPRIVAGVCRPIPCSGVCRPIPCSWRLSPHPLLLMLILILLTSHTCRSVLFSCYKFEPYSCRARFIDPMVTQGSPIGLLIFSFFAACGQCGFIGRMLFVTVLFACQPLLRLFFIILSKRTRAALLLINIHFVALTHLDVCLQPSHVWWSSAWAPRATVLGWLRERVH
jgi:hypothetical protein